MSKSEGKKLKLYAPWSPKDVSLVPKALRPKISSQNLFPKSFPKNSSQKLLFPKTLLLQPSLIPLRIPARRYPILRTSKTNVRTSLNFPTQTLTVVRQNRTTTSKISNPPYPFNNDLLFLPPPRKRNQWSSNHVRSKYLSWRTRYCPRRYFR